jgi:ferric-dicitrate binding protein FerR (iron transport regulator)
VVAHVLRRPAPEAPNESSTQTITTERAEQAQIRLADGTRVHLNAESEIQYPGRFSEDQRTVRLTGEAYFEVEADTVRPFVVTTETATVRVLGTAFMVDAYADSARTHVAVRHGRVTLAPDRSASSAAERAAKTVEELVISAGQWGVVDLSGQMLRRRSADVAHHFGWLNNQLVFRAAPLRSVARRLERWYDVEVRIVSSRLAERRLTATFSDEPLDEVLHALALSLNARYQRDGRTVTFHSASSSSRLPKP